MLPARAAAPLESGSRLWSGALAAMERIEHAFEDLPLTDLLAALTTAPE